MSDQEKGITTGTTQPSENVEIEYIVKTKRRSLLSRIGCLGAIVIWFFILLLPLLFFALAAREQITIQHSGDVPDKYEHPLLQFRLISDIEQRGVSITNSTVDRTDETNLCIETHVRYLLWEGQGDPATYHDLYTRPDEDSEWVFVTQAIGGCP